MRSGPLAPLAGDSLEIVQGGMGVAVSHWRLARAVSTAGQLGVVSGTALEVVCARRLQQGDPGGHVRRALAACPLPGVAEWILDSYFVEGGIAPDAPYRPVPRHTLASGGRVLQLTAAANFVEVYLAKAGHCGPVGINYLRKIELPLPAAVYGAILAGVDYVLVGAGNPSEIPELVGSLARHRPAALSVKVFGARSSDDLGEITFDPRSVWSEDTSPPSPHAAPKVLAIVASTDLAAALAADPRTRPDGFVVEGPSAGGHNAPPRGPRRVDDHGQPIYDERDAVDVREVTALGLPVWLAGSYGSPQRLQEAKSLGAVGVQVGTLFAYCDESGFAPEIVEQVRRQVLAGGLRVRSDWRASPTGFPFRVAELPGTLTDDAVLAARRPVCDLGMLRTASLGPDGALDYRCPAEPPAAYQRKGGREANTHGRVCLCNALFASAGMAQRRRDGELEPPLVTSGEDIDGVAALLAARAKAADRDGYSAKDVVDYLLGPLPPTPPDASSEI